ncbi:MAG: hypothetical protein V4710_18900 [Verrucomicrobiota bacterium]
MPDQEVTSELKQFIRTFIQSVEQLEILLLLHSQRAREWNAREVFQIIQSNEQSIARRLGQFVEWGFLAASHAQPATYRYAAQSEEMNRRVEEVARLYRIRPVLLVEIIFKPDLDPAQSFADAFRFKKP